MPLHPYTNNGQLTTDHGLVRRREAKTEVSRGEFFFALASLAPWRFALFSFPCQLPTATATATAPPTPYPGTTPSLGAGLYNADSANIVDADRIWWGDSSGPYHPQHNLDGLGDSVNTHVNITPFLTEPDTVAPPVPVQNLVVTNQGEDFIYLAWDTSPIGDLAGYKIYFDTDSIGFPYADTIDVGNNTSYTLSGLSTGLKYYIAATCYDTDGNESWYSNEVSATPTALAVEESSYIPSSFALHPAYPNPFNPATTIKFDLPHAVDISIVIYDLMGRAVTRLVDGDMTAGYHQVIWDGRTAAGREVPSGIYIARLSIIPPTLGVPATGSPAGVTPNYTKSIKMLLLK